MTFSKRLFRIQLVAQVALIIGGVATATIIVASSYFWRLFRFASGDKSSLDAAHELLSGLIYIPMFGYLGGAVPVIVYGAPVYAIVASKRRATWAVAILIGSLPGAVLLTLAALPASLAAAIRTDVPSAFATLVLGSGVLVACITHAICKKKAAFVGAA